MSLEDMIRTMARDAKKASRGLRSLERGPKDDALLKMAEKLLAEPRASLPAENRKGPVGGQGCGTFSSAMLDRLTLNDPVIEAPWRTDSGKWPHCPIRWAPVPGMWNRPNGLLVGRVRIPLGVIGFIFESRPNVTVDAAALCLKAGNAVILERRLGGDPFQHDPGQTAVGSPSRGGNSRKGRPGDPHH